MMRSLLSSGGGVTACVEKTSEVIASRTETERAAMH
jgi:hypothetical protein